jgi:hypothetical protein
MPNWRIKAKCSDEEGASHQRAEMRAEMWVR